MLSNEMEHSDSDFKIFIVNFNSEIVINLGIYCLVSEYEYSDLKIWTKERWSDKSLGKAA
jgi:hypothetical protein